ncbi:olfactory receptor 51V1-like [Latimeria chalumnae]|uniref:olfactory receptor 51V1-like n=1 Tax=Latimeria chalumnae TaxID=7897 RepID=UPI00313B11F1
METWIVWLESGLYVLPASFFIYINCLMVFIFFKEPLYQEQSRYILFIHMLINDSIQSVMGVLLFIFRSIGIKLIMSVCAVYVLVAGFPVFNLPVNLAFMALERYIAICNLLQHTEICTLQRTCKAVAIIANVFFVPVWVIVIYTYFKIVLEARKAAADKESALKACKTVILHVVQLIFR